MGLNCLLYIFQRCLNYFEVSSENSAAVIAGRAWIWCGKQSWFLMVNDPDRSDSNNEPGGLVRTWRPWYAKNVVGILGIPKLPISVPLRIPFKVWIWPTWGNPFWWSNATQHSIAAIAEVSSDLKCALQFQNFIFKRQWTWLLALCTYYIAEHIIRITKYSNTVIYIYMFVYNMYTLYTRMHICIMYPIRKQNGPPRSLMNG